MRIFDPLEYDDVRTYCDIYSCRECPRCGDDCDGELDDDEEEDDDETE